MDSSIILTINGKEQQIRAKTPVNLLEELGLDPARVALELNGLILKGPERGTAELRSGDTLEIIHFVGGG